MMKKKIYIAGPLFNQHERGYLETIANNLENNNPSNLPGKRVMRLRVFDVPVCRIGFVDGTPDDYFLGSK